jgi:hypothetical protein
MGRKPPGWVAPAAKRLPHLIAASGAPHDRKVGILSDSAHAHMTMLTPAALWPAVHQFAEF